MKQSPSDSSNKPTQIIEDLADVIKTVNRVEAALTDRGLICHSSSALGSLFAMVHRLANDTKPIEEKRWRTTFLRANEAARIARAVESALDDTGANNAIRRIIKSNMNLADGKKSAGKDALWELDLYRRLKLGKSPVRFGEPDLVVSLGEQFGEYGIACKKIYSQKNVENSFKSGCDQLVKHGRPGVVAFNLDDIAPDGKVWKTPTEGALKQKIARVIFSFINNHKSHFRAAFQRGDCDGILVSFSVISDVPTMTPAINIVRSSAVWNAGTCSDAQLRFRAFLEVLDRVLKR